MKHVFERDFLKRFHSALEACKRGMQAGVPSTGYTGRTTDPLSWPS